VEDALNATKAAVEEGIVIGGGCTLLKLAAKVEAIKATLENDEQVRGARDEGRGAGGRGGCRFASYSIGAPFARRRARS